MSCDLLVETARKIEQSVLPIRYMLIDDGHQQGIAENMQLKSFAPDPEKFPNGWDALLDMRREDGIKWIGIWHSFAGLQNTLHTENDFGDLNDHFMRLNPRNCMISPKRVLRIVWPPCAPKSCKYARIATSEPDITQAFSEQTTARGDE